MRKLLQEMIVDAQEKRPDIGIPRRLALPRLNGKATVVVGARRSGKSTLLDQLIARLRRAGVADRRILLVNFFDDRLFSLRKGKISELLDAYFGLYPDLARGERLHFFFDEIQMVDGWEAFIDRVLREENAEVTLTGSSSKLLSTELSTEMRGRALPVELFPFSLVEWLDARGVEAEARGSRRRHAVEHVFEELWEKGGFPEVRDAPPEIRRAVHQEYFKTIVHRDIVERFDSRHPRAILDLAHRLIDGCGSMYSINRLTGHLKSYGHRIPKAAVGEALEWFEDAFLFFTVRIFDASRARRETNPKKIYCIDHALVRSVSPGILVNSGHLLENLVFVHLRRRGFEPYYYRTSTGKEVDFIYADGDGQRELVQVAESIAHPETRARELAAAEEAMRELGCGSATLVTLREEESVEVEGKTISVVPAWRFLLDG